MARTASPNRIAVQGNRVLPGLLPLPTVSYETAIRVTLGESSVLEAYSRDTTPLISPKEGRYSHGFVAAVHAAYRKHFPLVLSPDMIWLLVVQGLAVHVRENAEALRGAFVTHTMKANLQVRRDTFVKGSAGNDWEGVLQEFSEQIRAYIGGVSHDTLVPSFSTTGAVERVAFEVALMDTLQHYFDYDLLSVCGIPAFLLEGTLSDWQQLRAQAEQLSQYELDWWLVHLLPVLDEFVAAASGNPNPTFWAEFYGDESCQTGTYICGMDGFMGHIVNFFPYEVNVPPIPGSRAEEYFGTARSARRNPSLGKRIGKLKTAVGEYGGRVYEAEPDQFRWGEVFSDLSLPASVSVAPFTWHYHTSQYPMEFLAGFVGARQERRTRAIRPEIGWAVRER